MPDAAEAMRQKLQTDLRAAIKGRQALDVSVLRGLIAAIDNAGAVPLTAKSEPPQHEVERRHENLRNISASIGSKMAGGVGGWRLAIGDWGLGGTARLHRVMVSGSASERGLGA